MSASTAPALAGVLDPGAAADVAAAYQEASDTRGALVRAAYARLMLESDELFRRIAEGPHGIHVRFSTCRQPYAGADELIASVRQDGLLEVSAAARDRDRRHPLMGCEIGGAYDRFRAVHDVLGHGCLGVGFGRGGEYAAWRWQERFHSPLARRALATELHAEHSVRCTTGEPPDHKAVLLDERIVARSRQGLP